MAQDLIHQEINRLVEDRNRTIEKIETENVDPTPEEQVESDKIISQLAEMFASDFNKYGIDDRELQEKIAKTVEQMVEALPYPLESRLRIKKTVNMTAFGYGPLSPLIEDDSITEIIVLSYKKVCIERNGRVEDTGITFTGEDHLQKIILRIAQAANRQPNISHPIIDAELKDGSRVQITFPPVVESAQMNIRKFRKDMMGYKAYIATGAISPRMMMLLSKLVKGKANIFISGGTGTGKTTMLNVLSNFIPGDEVIITIEDTYELQLQQDKVMRMRTRESINPEMDNIDQAALLKAALRKRPDRIIQGEARDGSIFDLINAMSTGHEGSLATVHADNPQDMCHVRIPNMYRLNAGMDFSTKDIQHLIAKSIEVIVQLKRYADGRRRVVAISYVDGFDENENVKVVDMYRHNPKTDTFVCTGMIPEHLIKKLDEHDVTIDRSLFSVSETPAVTSMSRKGN